MNNMMNMLKKKKVYDIDSESYDNKSTISNESSQELIDNKLIDNKLNYKVNENISKMEDVHNFYLNKTNEIEHYKSENATNLNLKSSEIERINVDKRDIKKSDFYCELCKNNSSKDNFFILSCDHIYHIQCLAETHFEDVYKYPVIDTEYFSSRKCNICYKQLQLDEVMYLHGKYLKNTKDYIERHQNSIESFEYQLKKMKEELRVCYEYKHKLEQQREKSKQIVSILSTMIYN